MPVLGYLRGSGKRQAYYLLIGQLQKHFTRRDALHDEPRHPVPFTHNLAINDRTAASFAVKNT